MGAVCWRGWPMTTPRQDFAQGRVPEPAWMAFCCRNDSGQQGAFRLANLLLPNAIFNGRLGKRKQHIKMCRD